MRKKSRKPVRKKQVKFKYADNTSAHKMFWDLEDKLNSIFDDAKNQSTLLNEEKLRKALTDFIVTYDKMTPEDRKKDGYKLPFATGLKALSNPYHIVDEDMAGGREADRPFYKPEETNTILQYILESGTGDYELFPTAVEVALDVGLDPEVKPINKPGYLQGESPLIVASQYENIPALEALLRYGAKPTFDYKTATRFEPISRNEAGSGVSSPLEEFLSAASEYASLSKQKRLLHNPSPGYYDRRNRDRLRNILILPKTIVKKYGLETAYQLSGSNSGIGSSGVLVPYRPIDFLHSLKLLLSHGDGLRGAFREFWFELLKAEKMLIELVDICQDAKNGKITLSPDFFRAPLVDFKKDPRPTGDCGYLLDIYNGHLDMQRQILEVLRTDAAEKFEKFYNSKTTEQVEQSLLYLFRMLLTAPRPEIYNIILSRAKFIQKAAEVKKRLGKLWTREVAQSFGKVLQALDKLSNKKPWPELIHPTDFRQGLFLSVMGGSSLPPQGSYGLHPQWAEAGQPIIATHEEDGVLHATPSVSTAFSFKSRKPKKRSKKKSRKPKKRMKEKKKSRKPKKRSKKSRKPKKRMKEKRK